MNWFRPRSAHVRSTLKVQDFLRSARVAEPLDLGLLYILLSVAGTVATYSLSHRCISCAMNALGTMRVCLHTRAVAVCWGLGRATTPCAPSRCSLALPRLLRTKDVVMSWTDDDRFQLKIHSKFNKPIAGGEDAKELTSAHERVDIQKQKSLAERLFCDL